MITFTVTLICMHLSVWRKFSLFKILQPRKKYMRDERMNRTENCCVFRFYLFTISIKHLIIFIAPEMDLTNLRDSLDSSSRERHPARASAKKSELRLTKDFKGMSLHKSVRFIDNMLTVFLALNSCCSSINNIIQNFAIVIQ